MTTIPSYEKIKTQNVSFNNLQHRHDSPILKDDVQRQSFRSVLEAVLSDLEKNWIKAEKHSFALIKSVPDSYKTMLQAQILISNLGLQVELVTKVADGVQSTIKKLQQQNN